jgi:hypothetical protein
MTSEVAPEAMTRGAAGGFDGDPAAAFDPPGSARDCCGNAVAARSAEGSPTAACCGSVAEARQSRGCCGEAAKAEAVAAGVGCCG